jgi:hypothetical protein
MVVVAPFEAATPLVTVPGQALTSVEAALVCVFGAWVIALLWERQMPLWRTPLMWPWAVFFLAMLVAAVSAPIHQENAVHMAGRFGVGLGVFLLTINAVTSPARLRAVLIAAAVAGAILSGILVLEYLDIDPVTQWLLVFRERVAVIGPQVRAAGPFQYPTIASMYLELVFAFVLALLMMSFDEGRRIRVALVFLLLVLIAQAITLTFTRAGLVTMASTIAICAGLRYRRRGVDTVVKAITAVAVLIGLQFLASRPAESVMLRLTTEGQQSWYSARVEAPSEMTIPAGALVSVPLKVTNTGRSGWDPAAAEPLRLSYHWLQADAEQVVEFEGLRTAFPDVVAPGATIAVEARVKAPGVPGRYRLLWDIVLERRLWFSTGPDAARYFTNVTVTGAPVGPPPVSRVTSMPRATPAPGRFALWRAGGRMIATHPLLGIGPDNFRLRYGEYGLPESDPRVHSNNMYLEMWVGGGIIGGLAFTWLCANAAVVFVRAARVSNRKMAAAAAGIAAAGAAIALHGLVDSFVSFTATYVLFAITVGLAAAVTTMDRNGG